MNINKTGGAARQRYQQKASAQRNVPTKRSTPFQSTDDKVDLGGVALCGTTGFLTGAGTTGLGLHLIDGVLSGNVDKTAFCAMFGTAMGGLGTIAHAELSTNPYLSDSERSASKTALIAGGAVGAALAAAHVLL